MPHLRTAVVRAPDQVVVRLTGDVDSSTAARLAAALEQAAGTGGGAVVVDVAGGRFHDCAGLQVLASFSDALVPAGRRCRIVGAPAAVRRLVRSVGLDGRLELDGPVDPVDPGPAVPLPHPGTPSPARRAVPPHQGRAARHAEERPARRRPRPLRRWH